MGYPMPGPTIAASPPAAHRNSICTAHRLQGPAIPPSCSNNSESDDDHCSCRWCFHCSDCDSGGSNLPVSSRGWDVAWQLEINCRISAMWSKMDSEHLEIARICEPKWKTPLGQGVRRPHLILARKVSESSQAMRTFPLSRHTISELMLVNWW